MIYYYLDNAEKTENGYNISGWTVDEKKQIKEIRIISKNKVVKTIDNFHLREDVINIGLADEGVNVGFSIVLENVDNPEIVFVSESEEKKITANKLVRQFDLRENKVVMRCALKKISVKNVCKGFKVLKKDGLAGLRRKVLTQNSSNFDDVYFDWYKRHKVTEDELKVQRNTKFEYEPKISILVPTYNTPEKLLCEMIDSVVAQSYGNFELCLADGSQDNTTVKDTVEKCYKNDKRVVYKKLEKNEGIAGNTNGALKIATGDFIGLLDHDDILEPNALFEVVKRLQDREVDVVYSDEDKVTDDLSRHLDPNFKPDFSIDLLRSHNYITHFYVVRKSLLDEIGGFRSKYDGSQDYDVILRTTEKARKIVHVPMILYNWRICVGSVAENPASKMYAYEAGKRAIEDHLERIGLAAKVEHTGLWGMYRVTYDVKNDPLVSIIIPNMDHTDDLNKCIMSIINKSIYRNFEIIIIENNSKEDKTFKYYDNITSKYDFVKVVKWDGIFNYSAINNFGIKSAKGEYLLLLNNDTEMISEDAISDMLGICMRDDVGIVGAKLLFADDTVQHAGVVIGFGNYAGHINFGIPRDAYGYMVRARITCNYSAVTAACLMTKKSVFDSVGGLTEEFVVACNDVDYCLKVREKNLLVVFDAFAEWYHYESKSRGYEDTPEKKARFAGEVEKFGKRWGKILKEGDPYYNPNFPVTKAPFELD